LYNQLDIRNYFPQEGGNYSECDNLKKHKISTIKGELWKNPLWRGFIKTLKATGVMDVIKKSKIKDKIRKMI